MADEVRNNVIAVLICAVLIFLIVCMWTTSSRLIELKEICSTEKEEYAENQSLNILPEAELNWSDNLEPIDLSRNYTNSTNLPSGMWCNKPNKFLMYWVDDPVLLSKIDGSWKEEEVTEPELNFTNTTGIFSAMEIEPVDRTFYKDCDWLIIEYKDNLTDIQDYTGITIPLLFDCLEWKHNPPNSTEIEELGVCIDVNNISYGECE